MPVPLQIYYLYGSLVGPNQRCESWRMRFLAFCMIQRVERAKPIDVNLVYFNPSCHLCSTICQIVHLSAQTDSGRYEIL